MGKKKIKQEKFVYYFIVFFILVSFITYYIGTLISYPFMSFSERLFNIVQCFRMESSYPEASANILLKIGSWLCPIAWLLFCATILVSFKSWIIYLNTLFSVKKSHKMAIQGDNPLCPVLCEELGTRAIYAPNVPVSLKAKEQILYFANDNNLLSFLGQNHQQLEKCKISILSDTLNPTSMENRNIELFYLPEKTAQEYWRFHPIEKNTKVAIIGFGAYGQEILLNALRTQIYSIEDCIEYHIYPLKCENPYNFCKNHWNFHLICSDKKEKFKNLFFFEEPDSWRDSKDSFKKFDRIIICPDKDEETSIIRHDIRLVDLSVQAHIHSKLSNPGNSLLYEDSISKQEKGDTWFGSLNKIYSSFTDSNSEILRNAQYINGLYKLIFEFDLINHNVDSSQRRDKYYQEHWKSINTKEKRSNIFAALHGGAKLKILKSEGISTKKEKALSLYHIVAADYIRLIKKYRQDKDFIEGYKMLMIPENLYSLNDVMSSGFSTKLVTMLFFSYDCNTIEKAESILSAYIDGFNYEKLCKLADMLLEIEHERWCRDYYLDNWSYGEETNKKMRIHKDLVPFSELKGDRQKDWIGFWAIMLKAKTEKEN